MLNVKQRSCEYLLVKSFWSDSTKLRSTDYQADTLTTRPFDKVTCLHIYKINPNLEVVPRGNRLFRIQKVAIPNDDAVRGWLLVHSRECSKRSGTFSRGFIPNSNLPTSLEDPFGKRIALVFDFEHPSNTAKSNFASLISNEIWNLHSVDANWCKKSQIKLLNLHPVKLNLLI